METDKMSTASSVMGRRPLLQALVIERRILFGCTVLIGLCTFVWITAVCTEKWVTIIGGTHGILLTKTSRYLLWSDSGVWRICRQVLVPSGVTSPLPPDANGLKGKIEISGDEEQYLYVVLSPTDIEKFLKEAPDSQYVATKLKYMQEIISYVYGGFWPRFILNHSTPRLYLIFNNVFNECTNYLAQPILNGTGTGSSKFIDLAYNEEVANYVRTMISFGIISLFVMAMGCGFSIYTFRNPRYMFKRLAAGIHFISTSCTFVVVQVMMSTVDYMKKSVHFLYPEHAYHYYHISFYLAWFVVIVNFAAGASFLWYSRKRKGDKAATEELGMADEPTIIGR